MHFFDKKHSFQKKEKSSNNKKLKHNSHSTFLKKVLGRVLDGGQDQNQTNLYMFKSAAMNTSETEFSLRRAIWMNERNLLATRKPLEGILPSPRPWVDLGTK